MPLGENVSIDDSAEIDISADVTIGDDVAISDGVLILTHDHDPADIHRTHASPLVIRAGAWLGARVIVLAACSRIGSHSVVGAGAVVTHDVPDGETWAGNPARIVHRHVQTERG
jgi:acetyltransferase-like isoleucine patch superfamily enzyme